MQYTIHITWWNIPIEVWYSLRSIKSVAHLVQSLYWLSIKWATLFMDRREYKNLVMYMDYWYLLMRMEILRIFNAFLLLFNHQQEIYVLTKNHVLTIVLGQIIKDWRQYRYNVDLTVKWMHKSHSTGRLNLVFLIMGIY